MQAGTHGRLPDGTEFVRWHPAFPLDEKWLRSIGDETTTYLNRWLALRADLVASGRIDHFVRKLIEDWSTSNSLVRPIATEGRPHVPLLLELGVDAAVAASLHKARAGLTESQSALPTEGARRQAAELLMVPIREGRDLIPGDFLKLHSLICTGFERNTLYNADDMGIMKRARGLMRSHPAFVVGNDQVIKEGCPPDRLMEELVALGRAVGDARRSGHVGPVRAAWGLYAMSVVHPFYDGNGRVARMFASFTMIRDGGFPLLIPPKMHRRYMDCVSAARRGEPADLIGLVAECQNAVLKSALAKVP